MMRLGLAHSLHPLVPAKAGTQNLPALDSRLRGNERRIREKAEVIRRARKLARKKLQREGLLPMKPRVVPGSGLARAPRF